MKIIRLYFLFSLLGLNLFTQTHFNFTSNTGNNATVAILLTTEPKIGDIPLQYGDEIGAFTPEGLCVGAVVWNNQNTALTVWGDNELSPQIDGIQVGQEIKFRVWKQSSDSEFICVNVTYSLGNGIYSINGIYILSSLVATIPPNIPILAQPTNYANGVSIDPVLKWFLSPRVESYCLQVSLDNSFNEIFVDTSGLTDTIYQLTGLEHYRNYYWRVNAQNCGGTTFWSETYTFRTIVAAPVLISPENNKDLISVNITLVWDTVFGATSYNLQVSKDLSFSQIVIDTIGISENYFVLNNLDYNTFYYWRVSASNTGGTGEWSSVFKFRTIARQLLVLDAGWGLISSNISPIDSSVTNIFLNVSNNFVLLKNGLGQVYWPSHGINTIGMWNIQHGYQIYMLNADTLAIFGREVIPNEIIFYLSQGWNMISYIRNSAMNIVSALSTINQVLVLAKNNYGQVYWPEYGINQIGNMMTGQGYLMYLLQPTTLIYPPNDLILTKPVTNYLIEPKFFKPIKKTGVYNQILLVMGDNFEDEDEIGIFTKAGELVGSGVIEDNKAVITIWAQDEYINEPTQDIYQEENLIVKYWSKKSNEVSEFSDYILINGVTKEPFEGKLKFNHQNILILRITEIKELPKEYYLHQNYPNPFNSKTIISYGLPEENDVKIEVYDLLGKRIRVLLNERQGPGNYRVEFNTDELPSGIYFYKISSGQFTDIKKMLLIK